MHSLSVARLREAGEAYRSFCSACGDRVAAYKIEIVATVIGGIPKGHVEIQNEGKLRTPGAHAGKTGAEPGQRARQPSRRTTGHGYSRRQKIG